MGEPATPMPLDAVSPNEQFRHCVPCSFVAGLVFFLSTQNDRTMTPFREQQRQPSRQGPPRQWIGRFLLYLVLRGAEEVIRQQYVLSTAAVSSATLLRDLDSTFEMAMPKHATNGIVAETFDCACPHDAAIKLPDGVEIEKASEVKVSTIDEGSVPIDGASHPERRQQQQQPEQEKKNDKREAEQMSTREDYQRDRTQQQGDKPYLLLHIGPPKTATTTIQTHLSSIGTELAQDGLFYAKGDKDLTDQLYGIARCGTKGNLTETFGEGGCWYRLREVLEPYRRNGTSVIGSAEGLSIFWSHQQILNRNAPIDWEGLQRALGDSWRIVVILGYRRLVDWVPSSHQQESRWKPSKMPFNKWPHNGGWVSQPLFPRWKDTIHLLDYKHTGLLVQNLNGTSIPHVVFNMHRGELPVGSEFVCHTLSEAGHPAPNACDESMRRDKERIAEPVVNPSQTLFYDVLTTAAASKGFVDYKVRRHAVVIEAEMYHNHVLNGTHRDFPVICPNKTLAADYLQFSLDTEARLLPEFASTPKGAKQHEKEFWSNYEQKKKYCWIDTDSVLEKQEWKDFFTTHIHNCTRNAKLYHQCKWMGTKIQRQEEIERW